MICCNVGSNITEPKLSIAKRRTLQFGHFRGSMSSQPSPASPRLSSLSVPGGSTNGGTRSKSGARVVRNAGRNRALKARRLTKSGAFGSKFPGGKIECLCPSSTRPPRLGDQPVSTQCRPRPPKFRPMLGDAQRIRLGWGNHLAAFLQFARPSSWSDG